MGCVNATEERSDHEEAQQTDLSPLLNKDIELPDDIPFEITWELCKKIRIELAWDHWHRSSEINEAYEKHKKEILAKYENMSSHLLNEKFNVELIENDEGKLSGSAVNLKKMTKWGANKFPYNFSNHITHDLLWCTFQLSKTEIINAIKENVPIGREIIWWVNPKKFRSVPGLYHVQILHVSSE